MASLAAQQMALVSAECPQVDSYIGSPGTGAGCGTRFKNSLWFPNELAKSVWVATFGFKILAGTRVGWTRGTFGMKETALRLHGLQRFMN